MTSFDAGNLLQSMKLRDNHVFYPGSSKVTTEKRVGIPPKAPDSKLINQRKSDQRTMSPMFAANQASSGDANNTNDT